MNESCLKPDPLVPPEVDLRDFGFMPVDVARVRDSGLAAEQTPAECWAAFLLWCASWHQVPAGSIPDSDIWQATQAGYANRGKIDPEWHEVRDGARRGYVTCNDGRLYHPVVCEKVLEAWEMKRARHARTAAATAARQAERDAKKRAEQEAQSKQRRGSRTSRSTSQESPRARNVHQGTETGTVTGTGTLSLLGGAVEPENAALSAQQSAPNAPKGANLELIPPDPADDSTPDPDATAAREPAARPSKKCPEGFRVSPELRAWARQKAPGVDIDAETEAFRDHTFGTARSDWDGTWRNWIRKARPGAGRPAGRPSYAEQAAATGAAWRGEAPRGGPAGEIIDIDGGGNVRRIEG